MHHLYHLLLPHTERPVLSLLFSGALYYEPFSFSCSLVATACLAVLFLDPTAARAVVPLGTRN